MSGIIHRSFRSKLFGEAIADLFRHTQTNHMSPFLYDDHSAHAQGESISGALMWQYAATREPKYYIARCDIECLQEIIGDISEVVPRGLPLIDLGPGSVEAVKNKSLRLLQAFKSSTYQPIDVSEKFEHDSEELIHQEAPGIKIIGKVANFLTEDAHHDFDGDVVAYYGGATISNLVCPSTPIFPYEVLTTELEKLSKLIKSGWIIISYDGVQDEKQVLEAYRTNYFGRFILNPLFRAAHELGIKNFDPNEFIYDPEWIPSAHLLANAVMATRDQDFLIGTEDFSIQKGERFNIVNSYKFTPQIFEGCCEQAGFEVVKKWNFAETPMKFYLLKCGFVAESDTTDVRQGLLRSA